jgi:hypothetical protein
MLAVSFEPRVEAVIEANCCAAGRWSDCYSPKTTAYMYLWRDLHGPHDDLNALDRVVSNFCVYVRLYIPPIHAHAYISFESSANAKCKKTDTLLFSFDQKQ